MKKILSIITILIIIIVSTLGFIKIFEYFELPQISSISTSTFEVDLFNLTNRERETKLEANPCLEVKARARAKQIVETGEFSHYYQGRKPYMELINDCISYIHAGENLAIDFKTVEAMHKALMASPTHKQNIIGDYTQAGFGCYEKVCVQFFAK